MRVALIIPAFNEEMTIKKVIEKFNNACPEAFIYVIDNNSSDKTNKYAKETLKKLKCKGEVFFEKRQGKGNALRRAFLNINADVYAIVDADLTYSEKDFKALLDPIINDECDMCVGNRHAKGIYSKINKRKFHNFGNNFVKGLVNLFFSSKLNDIMSGYRVFNNKFVKNFPIISEGFEVETEMTLHALDKKFRILEVPISYTDRPDGSVSKLNTINDGAKVLKTIFVIFKDYKPFIFFSVLSFLLFIFGFLIGLPVVIEFIKTKYITKVPSAILASGLMIISMLFFTVGCILDSIIKLHRYNYELQLLHFENSKFKERNTKKN
jgi:glycosyltransferase involved in cell wall biosynthesis